MLVDVLDLLRGLLLVPFVLPLGQLFAQFGYLLVFNFKLLAHILTLFENYFNQLDPGLLLQPTLCQRCLIRAGQDIAVHGVGRYRVKPVPLPP